MIVNPKITDNEKQLQDWGFEHIPIEWEMPTLYMEGNGM